jgi:CheY-like chemotaxis protein/chromosome segregation ATPase
VFSALIIDGDREAAGGIQGVLEPYGFEFTATHDAPEAMSLARTATPDIIFLRVELPNNVSGGFSVCNKLRRNDETKYIPLVMYASGVSDDIFNQHRNLKTHADEYLKLPISRGLLLEAVRRLIPMSESDSAADDLDVEIEDIVAQGPESDAEIGLDMPEFDREFAEMSGEPEVTEPSREYRHEAIPDPVREPDVSEETEAAFDALVDESEPEPELYEPEPELYEPEPEPEPELAYQAEPDEPEPESAYEPEPEPQRVSSEAPRTPSNGAASGASEFKAQREVIALKSQVNAKNRELLSLRDDLEGRDRAILDAKHKNRELMAQLGDLEERLLGSEERIITARETAEAAVRDKNTILKREEGLKTRFEHAQKKLKDVETELENSGGRVQEIQQEAQAHLSTLRAELRQAQAECETAQQTGQRLELELADAHQRAERLSAESDESRRRMGELAESVTELEAQCLALRTDAEQRLADALAEARTEKTAALQAQAREHQAELEFEETRHHDALERFKVESEQTMAMARAEVERLRVQITDAEESAHSERHRLQHELESERARASDERTKLHAQLEAMQQELEQTRSDLEQRIESLEQTRSELRRIGEELDSRRNVERRAQQALAVALRVLDGQPTQ